MSSSYRNTLNAWLSSLDVVASKVLDIGGSQESLSGRVRSWKVDEYLVADLPNPHKDSPKPDIEMDLNVTKPFALEDYDLIFCLEVFEYVYDPVNAMKLIASQLTPGGTAWVTFPSVYPLHQPIEDDALRYMPAGIEKLAARARLNIIEMIPRRPETTAWQNFISAERLRAAKNIDHAFLGYIVRFEK